MMKISLFGVVLAGLAGLLIITNPSDNAYKNYASEQLTLYLKDQGCNQVPKELGDLVKSQCKTLIDTATPQIKELIAAKTTRNNFLLFSIYKTELELNKSLPGYHFETLGVLDFFHTYQSEKI